MLAMLKILLCVMGIYAALVVVLGHVSLSFCCFDTALTVCAVGILVYLQSPKIKPVK